jgi:RHS repeat-associated protein
MRVDYKYGYQGSEKDDEIKGNGNSYTTEFRQLDPRLGRWLSIDPKPEAGVSPYSSMDNNPILFNDKLGLYTKRRAERMEKKAQDKGYSTGGVYKAEGGGKFSYGFNKLDYEAGEYSGQFKGKIKDIGSSSSGGGANFFGIDYDAIAKNKGNSSNDGKVSVWNKDYQESCKSNKAMQASAKHWNAVEVGLLKLELNILLSCFGGAGLTEQAIISGTVNFLSQTAAKNGDVGEVDGAGVAIATFSGLIPGFKNLNTVQNKCINIVTSSAIDGMVDVSFKGKMDLVYIGDKSVKRGVNDLVWNSLSGFAGMGSSSIGIPAVIGEGMPTFLGTMINEGTNSQIKP